jgi:hypothetical protein
MPELIINEEMVLKQLNSLKIDKSPGPDELHPRLLKELAKSLTKPFGIIFNQSLRLKMIPKEWKKATISAIFKKGNRSMAGNYRPVSLTSVVCKLLEKIIREHIIKNMKVNKLFSKKQFGFISRRSTSLQLLEVLDKWTEAIDKGTDVDVIYKDFQKAFDTFFHSFGIIFSLGDCLKIIHKGFVSDFASSFSDLGCNSSGPGDLSIFREFNCFKTISSFLISSGMFSLIFIGF